MNALDTNIWIYFHDNRDRRKQAIARDLVSHVRPLALPWQVGCEFLAAARKLGPQGFDQERARKALTEMRIISQIILLPTAEVWDKSHEIEVKLGLSLWDSLLAAACILGGVTTLYSEDFGTLSSIERLQLVNPFT